MKKLIKDIGVALWSYFKSQKKSWKFARGCLYIAGGLFSGPLWLPFLTALIEQTSGITIDEPSPLLALPVILLGAFVVIIPELVEYKYKYDFSSAEQVERRRQDSEYAKKIRDLLPTDKFETIESTLGSNHSIENSHRKILYDLSYELESTDTGFIDEEMGVLATEYHDVLDRLQLFCATNFFHLDRGLLPDVKYLFPEGNWDRGCPTPEQESLYSKLRVELNALLDELEKVRNNFLKNARNKLYLGD